MDIEKIKNIKIEDFDYPLPDSRIALHPLQQRDACKLIVSLPNGSVRHDSFSNLPEFIPQNALLICNETRVINARMEFFRASGARIEVFLLEPSEPADYVVAFASRRECVWTCMIGNLKKWKEAFLEKELHIPGHEKPLILRVSLIPEAAGVPHSGTRRVRFQWDNPAISFAEIVEIAGNIPIPPYLNRDSEESDLQDYQTVYSRVEGSVAAPTAGLHFTPGLFRRLEHRGVEIRKVTLHVGAGTFQPVKSENIGDHPMHTESIFVSTLLIREIADALETGRPIVAVGTTSVRTIESLPCFGHLVKVNHEESDSCCGMHLPQWLAYDEAMDGEDTVCLLRTLADYLEQSGCDHLSASTAIMIAPGFRWRIVSAMVTNFHQPQSTLLLLVSSFLESKLNTGSSAGLSIPRWRALYDEALALDYRFLSYGDACLLFPLNPESEESPHAGIDEEDSDMPEISLPFSKSVALRVMTMNAVYEALGKHPFKIENLPDSDDVKGMKRALDVLKANGNSVYIGEGAAPMRFFTALAASIPGVDIEVSASEGLMRRPMGILIDALRSMGASIECLNREGYPPLRIKGGKLSGDRVTLNPAISSQYTSALMMAAPLWENMLELDFEGKKPVSLPYMEMTAAVIKRFEDASKENPGREIRIEPDWSAASYFYEWTLLNAPCRLKIASLTPPAESLQGDSRCASFFAAAGVKTVFLPDGSVVLACDKPAGNPHAGLIEFDMGDTPDLVPALAVALPLAGFRFRFTSVSHLHIKETDRIAALTTEMKKLGFILISAEKDGSETLEWRGETIAPEPDPHIATYSDHRMAMAFAPARALFPSMVIESPEVVKKSFPDFWQTLSNLNNKLINV